MQVITTKYVNHTKCKGPRIRTVTGQGKFYCFYDHALDEKANHKMAAFVEIAKLENAFGGWAGEWVASESVTGEVYWCNATRATNRVIVDEKPNR